jgi:hypothetical protein
MAFELFTREAARSTREPRISVNKQGTLQLNASCLAQYFAKTQYVQLLYDAAAKRIAVKPAKAKDDHTYKLCRTKQGGAYVSARTFLKHYGIEHKSTKSHPAKWQAKPGAAVIVVK